MSYFVSYTNDPTATEVALSVALWLQEHSNLDGWTWPGAALTQLWYQRLSIPFKCQAGPQLRWFHHPFEVAVWKTTTDRRELTVLERKAQWFCVLKDPFEIWVQADDCVPFIP